VVDVAAFGLDQLGEPADLAVDRFQPVPLELEGVAVEPFPGAAERGPQPLALALDRAPPALQDPQPRVGGRVPEERQPDSEEPAVVVGLRPGLADQFVEALLAFRGDRVDDLSAAAGERWRVGGQQRVRIGLGGADEPG